MDNRAKLLNEAMALFATNGYDAVGVQTIVEAAQVTKPTLYHYFGSKLGLFETLMQEKSEPILASLQECTTYRHDLTKSITDTIRTYFQLYQEQPVFYRMMLSMWFAPPSSKYFESIFTVTFQEHEMIRAMFKAAENDHGNMVGRSQQYAVTLKGLINTYIGMALQGYVDLKEDALVYRVTHQFMHGIFS